MALILPVRVTLHWAPTALRCVPWLVHGSRVTPVQRTSSFLWEQCGRSGLAGGAERGREKPVAPLRQEADRTARKELWKLCFSLSASGAGY